MSFMKAVSWPSLELGGRCHRKHDVGQEPHFTLSEEHTLRRKGFLESSLIGSFSKWVGSPEAVRNWAAEAWNVKDGLKISQLGDTQYLFRFVDKSQASEILVRRNRWFDGNFLNLDRWVEHDGCLDPRFTGETLVVNMVDREIYGVFIDVTCSLHDLSRVRIVVRKGGRIPVSTVVEDGYLSYRVWLSPEFLPIFMPVIAIEEKGRLNRREGRGNQSLRGGEGSPDHWIKPKSDVRSRRDGRFEIGGGRQNHNRRRREWVSDAGGKGKMGQSASTYHRAGHAFSKNRPGPPHMGPATFPNSIRIDPKGPSLFQAAHDKASKHMGTLVPPSSGHGASHSDMCPSTMAATAGAKLAEDGAVNPRPPTSVGPGSINHSTAPGLSCPEDTLKVSSFSGEIGEHVPIDVSVRPVSSVNMPPRVPCSLPPCYPTDGSGLSYSSGVLFSEVVDPQGNGETISKVKTPSASNAMVLYSSGSSKERAHTEEACPISSRTGGGDMSFWMEDKLLNFGKFLGVSVTGKKDRVLELLREIEQQSLYDGAGRELGKDVKQNNLGDVVVYQRRGRGCDKEKGTSARGGGKMGDIVAYGS
ncbi:uncharacterized protein [Nicotiana tomentosiformis]|uniref:uncharacterized protein n=1 Tax=Nicotiana tomentosiformis TaxID=4098 RepID=UPI00388C59FA